MSALSDVGNAAFRDISVTGDVRDDPQWRALLGQGRKRRRIKHTPGGHPHNQDSHGGDGIPGVIQGDKLKGAGRIELEPGERLLRSERLRGEGGRAWLAVTEKDGKRSLRIGLGNANFGTRNDHGGPWRAGPDRTAEIEEERAELRADIEDLEHELEAAEADPETDPASLDERRAQLEELYGAESGVEESPGGHTAMLDENSARKLRETLAKALDDGKKLQVELDKPYAELDRLTLERDKLKRNAMGRKFTAEEDAEWDRLTAEIARAEAELDPNSGPARPESGFWTLAEGSIPGQWADVHWDIYLDDPSVGVEVKLGAVPHGSDMDFDDMRGAEMTASFDAAEANQLVRLLAKMESGDQPKSSRRNTHTKHGSHNQENHGNRGVDLIPPMAGLPVLDDDEYSKAYGTVLDERSISQADGIDLQVRVFELGDAHVVLDLPGGRHQVMSDFDDTDGMRALAGDIRAMRDTEIPDTDPTGELIADADSRQHDYYTGVDDLGNIWLRTSDQAEDDYLELSDDEADDLADALEDMADTLDEEFGDAAEIEIVGGKSLRKHGTHDQRTHGRRRAAAVLDVPDVPAPAAPPKPPKPRRAPKPKPPRQAAATADSGPDGIRESLRKAKTSKAISVAAQKESERLTEFGVHFDLDGADPEIARQMAEGVLRGLERFPKADLSRVRLHPDMVNGENVMASVSGDEMRISTHWAGDPKRFHDSLKVNHFAGYMVAESPMGVAVHEFGHIVAQTGDSERSSGRLAVSAAGGHSHEHSHVRDFVGSQISRYAASNDWELTAEAFADVMLNGDKASDLSKELFEHIEEQYRRAVG